MEFRLKNISYSKQAAIIARKKEATAEKLNDTRNELSSMDEEINEKREQVQSFAGETVLRGDDFKRYVASLRGKSNTYKKRRAELSEYRAEYGVLSRTLGRCPIIRLLLNLYHGGGIEDIYPSLRPLTTASGFFGAINKRRHQSR